GWVGRHHNDFPFSRVDAEHCHNVLAVGDTTSVPGPPHAPIVARASAVSASRMAFNTKALLNVGATSTGPMFINSAVCRHRHHWELTTLSTFTCCVRKRSPRARASARPCSLKLRWVPQSSSL